MARDMVKCDWNNCASLTVVSENIRCRFLKYDCDGCRQYSFRKTLSAPDWPTGRVMAPWDDFWAILWRSLRRNPVFCDVKMTWPIASVVRQTLSPASPQFESVYRPVESGDVTLGFPCDGLWCDGVYSSSPFQCQAMVHWSGRALWKRFCVARYSLERGDMAKTR